jgi:hypothetical protein
VQSPSGLGARNNAPPTVHRCVFLFAATGAVAQSSSPYVGMQSRPIKALSDQQMSDLKGGRGMSLALAAELNGYPGPLHLLELADQIGLSAQQRAGIKRLFDSMKAEAVSLGETLLAQEAELDRQFAERTVTAESLQTATAAIGQTQASLRNTHLKYHLATVPLLSAQQMHRYAQLRGYATQAEPGQRSKPHAH